MELEDFFLMQKGFWKRKEYEQHLLRRAAYIIHASMVSKPLHPDKIWPIGEVKKLDKEFLRKRSESVMERVLFMQKIEDEKKKWQSN